MTPTTELKPLSHNNRRIVFTTLVIIFVLSVPLMVFYAIGYRFDLSEGSQNIKSVGGLYISSGTDTTDIYVDDELIEDVRIFRSAAYIQNLEAGVHAVHVQGDGVQTWVKDLPVFPHYVTEAQSFNMPLVPQIRIVTQWNTAANKGVLFEAATSTFFAFASSTEEYILSTSTATSTYTESLEYLYIEDLFASSTQEKNVLLAQQERERKRFAFGPLIPMVTPSSTATTSKTSGDFVLFEDAGEVYVTSKADSDDIPYYFCVRHTDKNKTIRDYGLHVYEAFDELYDLEGTSIAGIIPITKRLCRDTIRIDRIHQEVLWFDFYPRGTDFVLMQLTDGLYAVEVDDRSWQNTQLLYPGSDLHVIIEGGRLYVLDRGYYLEIFTEIATP